MKQIVIAGSACEELPIYLSSVLNNGGHKSVIVDYSKDAKGHNTLVSMFEDPNEEGGYPTACERGELKIVTDVTELGNEEVEIRFFGDNTEHIDTSNTDLLILGTDMYAHNVKKIKAVQLTKQEPESIASESESAEPAQDSESVPETNKKSGKKEKPKKEKKPKTKTETTDSCVLLFINDLILGHKYGAKYIKTVSGHPDAAVISHAYNMSDITLRYNIGYEKISLAKLSDGYKRILMDLYLKITGEEANKKLLKTILGR